MQATMVIKYHTWIVEDLQIAYSKSEVRPDLVLIIHQAENRSLVKATLQKNNLEVFTTRIKVSKFMTCQTIMSLIMLSQSKVLTELCTQTKKSKDVTKTKKKTGCAP